MTLRVAVAAALVAAFAVGTSAQSGQRTRPPGGPVPAQPPRPRSTQPQPPPVVTAPPPTSSLDSQTGRLFPPTDLGLIETPDRDDWNKPDLIMDILGIADGAVVADLGAGGGWFTSHLARRVGPNGTVYAQDIQREMIEAINRRTQTQALTNVRPVLGTRTDPRLPGGIDAALIIDAYHEMEDPARPEVILALLRNVDRALKPQGRLGIVDFLPGDGGPGPAAKDRVLPETIIKAAQSAGFQLLKHETIPPFQFLLVFGKTPASPARAF